jgi:predicted nucleotidyltransferase
MSTVDTATDGPRTDELSEALVRLVATKYGFLHPSVYLHGSRRDGSEYAESDLDVTVIVDSAALHANIYNDVRNLELDVPVALDATIHTIASLNTPDAGFDAGRLLP